MNRRSDDAPNVRIEWHEGDLPWSAAFGDRFYSRADGRGECDHVFIKGNGLAARWRGNGLFVIGELGFGTGLNFCETWRQWRRAGRGSGGAVDRRLQFVSFEKHPLSAPDIDRALRAWPILETMRRRLTRRWPARPRGSVRIDFDGGVALEVHIGDALARLSEWTGRADAWFLDGFDPARNPRMWSPDLLRAVFARTVPGGTFATYSAAGRVRRDLAAAGFRVDRRKGYARKREMLAGTRPA